MSTEPITSAAQAFLDALDADRRGQVMFPLDAEERRTWFNVHPNVFRHGVMLENMSQEQRDLGLRLLRATLSHRGFGQARDIMRLNELLVHLSNRRDEFGEWPYFVSIFGDPARSEPWAWQVDGHHLCLNCTVVGDQMVLTPAFMGSEPCHVYAGPFAGTTVFAAEERAGLDLMRSLDDASAAKATLRPSIHPDDLPPELQHPAHGRMRAGAFQDNAKIACEGVAGTDLWMGASDPEGPFYYRVQSPVVLVEFDHHPGVVFDNLVPSRNHIHTVVRMPNGGDYGVDLLRLHHDRFDHSSGRHVARS